MNSRYKDITGIFYSFRRAKTDIKMWQLTRKERWDKGMGAQTSEDSAAWTLLGVTDIEIYIFVTDIRIFIFLTIKLPFITLYCD